MKKVVIGAITISLAFIFSSFFYRDIIILIVGTLPLLLILSGALIIYLKHDSDSVDPLETVDIESPAPASEITENPSLAIEYGVAPLAKIEPTVLDPEPIRIVTDHEPADNETPADTGTATLVGNTGSLVFHTTDCKFSTSKQCTATFSTREEAVENDYKPCGVCKP